MNWTYDNPAERARVEEAYLRLIHQRYIDEHPEVIPTCACHPMTREARLSLLEIREEARQ